MNKTYFFACALLALFLTPFSANAQCDSEHGVAIAKIDYHVGKRLPNSIFPFASVENVHYGISGWLRPYLVDTLTGARVRTLDSIPFGYSKGQTVPRLASMGKWQDLDDMADGIYWLRMEAKNDFCPQWHDLMIAEDGEESKPVEVWHDYQILTSLGNYTTPSGAIHYASGFITTTIANANICFINTLGQQVGACEPGPGPVFVPQGQILTVVVTGPNQGAIAKLKILN